ncbi:MAG: bacterial transcriptional activator domain-containing protein [Dehalococcoidia bacterium]
MEVNPYDGEAWTALIRGHIRRDMRGAAFRLYRRCQDVFTRELGIGPPAAVTSLTSELLA